MAQINEVTLERRFFKTLETGDNEFDWVLQELGVKGNTSDIDEITIEASVKEIVRD